jgi:hypothetical protein
MANKTTGFWRAMRLGLILVVGIVALALGTSRAASINDVFAAIAMRVPEFGGVHIDEQQDVLYVHLRNGTPAAAQAVVAELKTAFGDHHLRQGKVQALPATFGFSELKHWHDQIAMDVLQHPGVTFIGIDHANNRVVIGVEDAGVRSSLEPDLAGFYFPSEAVNFTETGPIQLKSNLSALNRPIVGGLQNGTPFASCSVGFNATRASVLGFVTASHCSNPDDVAPGRINTVYTQPSGGSRVGVETVDPGFHGCYCTPRVFGFRVCLFNCRSSDSAFVRLDPAVSATLGLIAATPPEFPPEFLANPLLFLSTLSTPAGSTEWDGKSFFHIVGGGTPFVGLNVTKVGQTSGRTDGIVLLTGLTVPLVSKSFPFVTRKLLQNQVLATYLFEAGDSGAPVLHVPIAQLIEQLISGGDAEVSLLGIAWGGLGVLVSGLPGALFSPISGVQADLGPLTFVASPNPDLVAVSSFTSGFCTVGVERLRVVVRVENRGGAFAPASITRVSFPPFASFDLPTPGIPAGGFVDLQPIETPPGCFNPDCGFAITVDAFDNVNEGPAGEANNTVTSSCVG